MVVEVHVDGHAEELADTRQERAPYFNCSTLLLKVKLPSPSGGTGLDNGSEHSGSS